MTGRSDLTCLSVVIPTLNAAETLGATLASLEGHADVTIIDGGSTDATLGLARVHGARVLSCPSCGRGGQLALGADLALGEWLLFLHADTVLEAGWPAVLAVFIGNPDNRSRAAAFRFALDDDAWQARVLEWAVGLRTRVLRLPYGDQGLLIYRPLYEAVGGYRPLPLMEDIDLVRRLGAKVISPLTMRACTSARRWRAEGWIRRTMRNLYCLTLYFIGVSPARIAKRYAGV
jgi:rSAM/selenodomain-associated transferase 2